MLDIGANVGAYARYFADHVGATGYVLAVEPDPDTAMVCAMRAAQYPQIHVRHAAVTSRSGMVPLYRDRKDHRRNSLWPCNVIALEDEAVMVPAVTLDNLAVEVPKLRIVKIDAQGAEADILAGATETLQRDDLLWIVELWPLGLQSAGASVRDVTSWFARYGWEPAGHRSWEHVCDDAAAKTGHGSIDVLVRKA